MPAAPKFDNGASHALEPIGVALPIVMACVLLVAGRKLPRVAVDEDLSPLQLRSV